MTSKVNIIDQNNSIMIRKAADQDVKIITKLVNQSYWEAQTYLVDNENKYRTNEKEVLNYIKNKKIYLLIRKNGDTEEVGGTILYDRYNEGTATFELFAVDTQHFKGMGNLLILHVEAKARKEGKTRMVIEAISCAKALINYYQRRNYKETGETHPFAAVSSAQLRGGFEGANYIVLEKSLNDAIL